MFPIRRAPWVPIIAIGLLGLSVQAQGNDAMEAIKKAASKQAQGKMAQTLNLPTAAPEGAKVYIIEPKAGATVSSPVKIVFGLHGMGVAPAGVQNDNTGHHHLLIDDPQVNLSQPLPASEQVVHFGGGQTQTEVELSPGKHKIQLILADWKHQSFNPPLMSQKISITVE